MNDSNQSRSQGETQRDLLESGERAMQRSITMPIDQAVELQRNVARLFLTGLEMQDRAQNQWIDVMKTTFDDYLNTMEATAEGVSQATRQGVHSAMEQGQAVATGESGARSSGTPQGSRQEPSTAPGQAGGQGGLRYTRPPGDRMARGAQYGGTGRATQGAQYQRPGRPAPGTEGSTYEQPPGQEYGQAPSRGQGYGGAESLSYGQPEGQGREFGEPGGQGPEQAEGQQDRTQPPEP